MRPFLLLLVTTAAASAVSIPRATLSTGVDEKSCNARNPVTVFRPVERQVFVSFVARDVAAGDRLRIEWVREPDTVADSADYANLPAASSVCFVSQLPLSGFPASSQPGRWSVRIVVNGKELVRAPFEIASDGNADRIRINSVSQKAARSGMELQLDGAGFDSRSVVHVAEYKKEGGWRYIHSLLPELAGGNRLTVVVPALGPGEYLAIVRGGDDALSRPARFLVSTGNGYQLPLVPGEQWLIAQTPYGSFSHWGNSIQAYDIAPVSAMWVAAMRGGVVRAHDVGAGQLLTSRTFGNYITIDHGDGDYSHYAHLTTGTYRVKTGEHVQAGQILARVGTSGYSFGLHVHVHVTRSESISAQSVPFRFSEFASVEPLALKNREVTGSATPVFTATTTKPSAPARESGLGPGAKRASGSVAVAGTWDELIMVPAGAKVLEILLSWQGEDRDLDLRVVSPSGQQYGALGQQAGYSGAASNPERLKLASPEAGAWRVIAAGMRGGGEAIEFTVETAVAAPSPVRPVVAAASPPRRVAARPSRAPDLQ